MVGSSSRGAPERLPVANIGARLVEGGLRAAERARRDVEPAAVEAVHRDAEAGTLAVRAAQHRVGGHPHALEDHLRGGLRMPAHLLLVRAETQPGSALFDDERGDAARALATGAGHHHVDIGGSRAGDELLDAVEHVVAALLDGAGAQRAGVGAGAGLGQAVAGDDVHRGQPRHPGLALFGGAEGVDHPRAHVVDGQERGDRRVGDGQLLEDAHPVESAQPAAADVVAAVDRRHAEFGGLAQHVDRKVLGGIPFQGVRGEAFGGERGRRLGDDPFVVVQGEQMHRRLYFIVGMTNSAPSLMPDGHRDVTVLTLV